MTAFRYEAARADGGMVKGALEAASRAQAAATLSERGLFPILVEPAPDRVSRRRADARAVATVIQGLATLVDAGVPLAPALDAAQALASGPLCDALGRVAARVRQGSTLGAAMAEERACFSGLTVGLIRAGERGVGLGPALAAAASQLDRMAETGARVRAALTYPLLLALVGSLSVGLIVLFVVPRFAAILGDLGQTLPPATRMLIAASGIAHRYGLVVAAFAVPVALLAQAALRRRRTAWHDALLRVPVVGPLRHGLASARVTRTLGALLETGTPALAALATSRDAAGDQAVSARLDEARDRVAEGASLTAALRRANALTEGAFQLAAIGEKSGRLPALLGRAAELEERQAERRLETLVRLLEPALIVIFAALVAFVAAALLQAVYAVRPG